MWSGLNPSPGFCVYLGRYTSSVWRRRSAGWGGEQETDCCWTDEVWAERRCWRTKSRSSPPEQQTQLNYYLCWFTPVVTMVTTSDLSSLASQQQVGGCDVIILHLGEWIVDLLSGVTQPHHHVWNTHTTCRRTWLEAGLRRSPVRSRFQNLLFPALLWEHWQHESSHGFSTNV